MLQLMCAVTDEAQEIVFSANQDSDVVHLFKWF